MVKPKKPAPISTKPTKKPNGRPRKISDKQIREILSQIAIGNSLAEVCKGYHIHPGSVIQRACANEELSLCYARAMEQRTEFQAQEILTIADDPTIEPNDKRIRVDTRKWIMARMKPKRYGDHLDVRHDVPEQVMAAVVYALAHPKPVDKSADKPVDKPK